MLTFECSGRRSGLNINHSERQSFAQIVAPWPFVSYLFPIFPSSPPLQHLRHKEGGTPVYKNIQFVCLTIENILMRMPFLFH